MRTLVAELKGDRFYAIPAKKKMENIGTPFVQGTDQEYSQMQDRSMTGDVKYSEKKLANICLALGVLSWVLYVTVIPGLLCAIACIHMGNKANKNMHSRKIKVGLFLAKAEIFTYLFSAIIGIVCVLI